MQPDCKTEVHRIGQVWQGGDIKRVGEALQFVEYRTRPDGQVEKVQRRMRLTPATGDGEVLGLVEDRRDHRRG